MSERAETFDSLEKLEFSNNSCEKSVDRNSLEKSFDPSIKSSFDATEDSSCSLKRKHEDDFEFSAKEYKKSNTDDSFCVSPWEFRRLKADLLESQAQKVKLEDRIDQLHKKNKEAVIFFDKEKSEMKIQLDLNRNTIKDLEFRLNKIRKRETDCKEELNEKTKMHELAKKKLNAKIYKLEKENAELICEVNKIENNNKEITVKLSTEVKELKNENEKLKLALEEKESIQLSLEERLAKVVENHKEYEEIQNQLQLAQLTIKNLENEKKEFEEAKGFTISLSEKIIRIPALEKELNEKKLQVANLRQFLHNNLILEEMVHNLKIKLAGFEEREKEIPILKEKIMKLELELEKWMTMASDYSNNADKDSLKDYIESLQRKELTSNLEINNLNAAIQSSEKNLFSFKNEIENVKNTNEKLENSFQKLKVEVQVLRKKLLLVSRERDSYRQQLDLYEKDLTMTGISHENLSSEMLAQMKMRVKNLEVSLGEYRKHVETLEEQLKNYQIEEPLEHFGTVGKLKEEIKALEESNKTLRKIKDELEQRLEALALKGSYVSPDVKVLHFRNNPAAEAENKQEFDMKSLMEENAKLRTRMKLLESGEILDITQKVSEDLQNFNSQKISELEKELQSANLKMQRLKEVFKKTSQEFRDVSYMLLGYRIDLASNNKLYKLYNMYSSSPLDFLMFQQTKTGAMEMLGTDFAESQSKLVNEYLHKGNSIPAFLSAVTLELYGSNGQSDADDNEDNEDDEIDERNRGNTKNFRGSESCEPIDLD